MTVSLSSALSIATRSIQTNQSAIGTISHNVANVNTAGYTRQIIQISSDSFGGIGSGASVTGITRQIDQVLARRITDQQAAVGYNSTILQQLQNVETLFPTGASSLENLSSNFFQALNDLNNYPDSSSQQLNVVKSADLLADTLNITNSELVATAATIDNDITESLVSLNEALQNIFELNGQIRDIETSGVAGVNSNDLRDERQIYLNQVSEKLNVNIIENPNNGSVTVYSENGRKLVDDTSFLTFSREAGSGSYQDIVAKARLVDGTTSSSVIVFDTSKLSSGSLKALVDVRDTIIPQKQAELDNFASTLITSFNAIHSRGTSFPPQNALSSGVEGINATTTDLYADATLGALDSASFNISVVNKATGQVISTTLTAGGGAGPVTLPTGGTFSLDDLDTLIEANGDVAGDLTVTTGVDSEGNSFINIAATDSNNAIVLSNASGDVLGLLQFNRFFSGSSAEDIAVESSIASNPGTIATARMRQTDGGVSALDNQNVSQLAALGNTKLSFSAAGGLGSQNLTLTGYSIQIISSLAVDVESATNRESFSSLVLEDLETRQANISGVNMDEELANLLVFQNAFQASARVISVVDELFDSLLQIR